MYFSPASLTGSLAANVGCLLKASSSLRRPTIKQPCPSGVETAHQITATDSPGAVFKHRPYLANSRSAHRAETGRSLGQLAQKITVPPDSATARSFCSVDAGMCLACGTTTAS